MASAITQMATLSVSLFLICLVDASSDFNPHSNFKPSGAQYTFSQDLSFDPVEDSVNVSSETESLAFYSDTEDDESNISILSSSLLFDGCFVSSQAMMCHGGDMWGLDMQARFDSDLDDSDDDDDDDADDGHSSMLSNASLRRSRVSSNGIVPMGKDSSPTSIATTSGLDQATSSFASQAALSIRGGASSTLGSEFIKKLWVAAIVTLVYETVLGHLLEFVKIVMQTSPAGTTYGDVLRSITAEKGILGVWDGFVPWGIVQSVFKGGVFGFAHAVAAKLITPLADDGRIPKQLALTLAGGIGGGFQGYVLSPTLLLKTRVMTNPIFREKMSLLRTTLLSFRIGFDVVANEGLGALMKGSNVFATKRVFDWATRYYFSDVFSALMLARKGGVPLTAGEMIAADLLGGTASTLATLPLDVLVAKTQDAKKAGMKVSAWALFQEELKELGWEGLWNSYMRGFEARLAHVCFTTVAMKTGSAVVYDAIYGDKH